MFQLYLKSHYGIILNTLNKGYLSRTIMDLILIGKRIKFIRLNSTNFSQEDFANRLGFDRSYISRVETGKQNLTVENLIKICEGLSVPLKDFFDLEKIDFD